MPSRGKLARAWYFPVMLLFLLGVEAFAAAIRRYFPAIQAEDLAPDYAGIRPKLAGPGEAAADFVIQDGTSQNLPGLFQLFGIESPGLTASLAIGELVSDEIREFLG